MAANFQHMGGQMMPNQQQRPPQNGAPTQINQLIFQTLNAQTGPLTGWQAGVLIQERISLISNIIGNLRLASQHQANPPPMSKMMEIGLKFEKDIFEKSVDKEQYKKEVQQKLDQLLERRAQHQAALQQNINAQAQAQAQAQQQRQMMMNQNNMQGQMPNGMAGQQPQLPFHLQHQMQASPIPGQQPPQIGLGMTGDGLPPNMTPQQQQQQQFQLAMQQRQQQQQQAQQQAQQQQQQQQAQQQQQQQPQPQQQQGQQPGQQQMQQPNGARPPGGQQFSPQEMEVINRLTTQLMAAASAEEKNNIRAGLQGRMDAQTFARYQAQGIDPLLVFFRNQAVARFRAEKNARQAQQAQQAQQLGIGQQSQNIPATSQPMQPQRSMGPSPMPGQAQPVVTMPGGANTEFNSFLGNTMESIIGQQQQAGVMAQEAGQVVVPASSAQRNATPQIGMNGPGLNQRPIGNPAAARAQQQQFLNSQQAQQQRIMQNAQQTQAQLRANAQQKANMSLQGQPGGLGPGPMPPRQSPAMPTLNAPVPGTQQMTPETPQMNANGQVGQPLDPRFMQNNQRPMGQGNAMNGLNSAIFANMPIEQQNRLSTLPPERLNEVLARWHESRAQMVAAQAAQANRQQMPMQGNNQMRPGQPNPQAGQFGPQNPMNQFLNPQAQQRQPGMQNAMNPQQLAIQQQIARMQNPQQRAQMTPEQRLLMQMDNVDFPPNLVNHAQMPRGIPPELKKWGQLKQWASQNPSILPEQLESIKGLQKIHYQQIIRAKQNQQAMAMNGGQPGQTGIPGMPPGMPAPVAQMGANPMQGAQMNMGVNGAIRQPTMMEIQNVRNHPSGKMAGATDDQIRQVLMKHQMNPQQQQQQQQQRQQQLLQMHMANNMALNAGQRPGLPQGQMQPNGFVGQGQQPVPPQMQQSKSASGPEATPATTATARAKNQKNGPTSSPAQPANKLKRPSSDDVVEVPNPNTQQSAQQQAQRPNLPAKVPQGNRVLTPQQVQNLDPEARKRYEQALRASQANQAPQVNEADMEKLKTIMQEESMKAREPLPDIPMDAETKASMAKLLRDILSPLANVGKAVPKWYQLTHDQTRARMFFRTRHRIARQFRDNSMTQLRDSFSIKPAEIDAARAMLAGMVKDLTDRFPKMKKPDASQPTTQPPASTQAPATQTAPLNAANLQQQQQQLKMHSKSASKGSMPPAAPTTAQPPFPFGATSPHGQPAYMNKPTLTQDDLVIPPKKRQKPNSTPVQAQTTPGSNASPQVGKAVSPETRKQSAAETKPQAKPTRICPEPECERHTVGFDSDEALKQHTQDEHIKPLENPLKYAQESLAATLGLNEHGQPKVSLDASNQDQDALGDVKMEAVGSKQGLTPSMKTVSTPAGTASTPQKMDRQGSTTGAKAAGAQKKADAAKDGSLKVPPSDKQPAAQPAQELPQVDLWTNATVDPHELLQSFSNFESGAGGAISDMNVYRSITPNDTPESSKDSGVSEPNSDISDGVALDINLDIFDEKWMPFGPSDVDMSNIAINEDALAMFDTEPITGLSSWEDLVDQSAFDKPFQFDTSFYSMTTD
ncbi:hypothetical protein F5884DRAFT_183886 [Xylogone sp. PMI_703]|nr:hypothetical protein F5884DRAFT_183886 [Xylogone sp. PMI_703]